MCRLGMPPLLWQVGCIRTSSAGVVFRANQRGKNNCCELFITFLAGGERERQRETERETETETDRETQTDRQTDRGKEREREELL